MNNLSGRSLLSRAAVGFTSIGVFSAALSTSEGQFVWKASEWKLAEFQKLLNDPARIKQVCDVVQIGDGRFLNNIKNSFNGLQFGFGVPKGQVKIAAALQRPRQHLLAICGIALLVFGPKKLPELGKGIGEGIRGLRSALKEREEPPTGKDHQSAFSLGPQ